MNAEFALISDEFKPLIDALSRPGLPDVAKDSPVVVRALYSKLSPKGGPVLETVRDIEHGGVRGREYVPAGADATIVFYHGGGWVIGSVDDYDFFARTLASMSGMRVLSVEYRLAPEHPFPAGVEDAWAFLRSVTPLGPLFVAGDSAGGNLSAVMTQMARDAGGPALAGQVLIYPPVAGDPPSAGRLQGGEPPVMTSEHAIAYYDLTIPKSKRRDPRFAPAHGRLAGLPPALIVTASADVLTPEAEDYASALLRAGVEVRLYREDGAPHGFVTLAPASRATRRALEQICRFLDAHGRQAA